MLLAVSGPEVGIDPKEDADYSCRIQAAVPMYPHCAASWEGRVPPQPYPSLPMFAKPQAEAPTLWDSASPIKQLSKDDPPMLILHGTADKTTPPDQSKRFDQAAKKIGVPTKSTDSTSRSSASTHCRTRSGSRSREGRGDRAGRRLEIPTPRRRTGLPPE